MRIDPVSFRPIGIIHSQHQNTERIPIQPVYAGDCQAQVEIFPKFADGLRDLDGFSHIYLIYHFHRVGAAKLLVKPFLQDVERGVFATRSPNRPNPIGLSIVELIRRDGNILHIKGADILDGTPLLDIKPYIKRFDRIDTSCDGWQEEIDEATAQMKGRRK
ncbi:MAG: tRNA (N6-threonylcarbamoyladenosine(37)-N6)-methyltransferase TrmO [Candidatus Marinimicrobia bacterium]|jgi:tRNA-Thr(GGU) m(6)t(6)A37 methyltransferase TsaA|nr:tRNA (N6-threonylcarbamoyladenosine(37)-N6)-methyltransferase TrmO [Candidatus Neomarinimicrobiota bacterium]